MEVLFIFIEKLEINFTRMTVFPIVLFIDGIIATYFFVRLSKRMKKLGVYAGVIPIFFLLVYTLTETFNELMVHQLPPMTKFLISSIGGIFLIFLIEFLSDIIQKISIFLAGTLGSFFLIVQSSGYFQASESSIQRLVIAAIIAIICGGGFYKMIMALERTIIKLFTKIDMLKIIFSSILGAAMIAITLISYQKSSNLALFEAVGSGWGIFRAFESELQIVFVVVLAISGMMVQTLLLWRSRRKKKKTKLKEEILPEKVQVHETVT